MINFKLDKEIKEMTVENIMNLKETINDFFDIFADNAAEDTTIEDLMISKVDLLCNILNTIRPDGDTCYFCNCLDEDKFESCDECPYGIEKGFCNKDDHSPWRKSNKMFTELHIFLKTKYLPKFTEPKSKTNKVKKG